MTRIERVAIAVLFASAIIWLPTIKNAVADAVFEARYTFPHSVSEVLVEDGIQGDHVMIYANGAVQRDFIGSYVVQVQHFPSRRTACTASDDRLPYRTGTEYSQPVTLEWWADDAECTGLDLAAGQYVISTKWTDNLDHPHRANPTHTVDSNVFVIRPIDAKQAVQELRQFQQEIAPLKHTIEQMELIE
jgi:hypothetical protein